jgi:hypothetical protein
VLAGAGDLQAPLLVMLWLCRFTQQDGGGSTVLQVGGGGGGIRIGSVGASMDDQDALPLLPVGHESR